MKFTLTFDNDPDVTPGVLKALAARGLTATFFPVGERLEDPTARALMRDARVAGHRIGNHTYSHPRPFGGRSGEAAVAEIKRTDALLGDLVELDRLFRPSAGGGALKPGVLNRAAVDHLIATGHSLVLWNLICEDWKRPDGSWVEIALAGLKRQPWTLLVLHDTATGAMDSLDDFLDRALTAGAEVVADYPPETTPIWCGACRAPVDHLLSDG